MLDSDETVEKKQNIQGVTERIPFKHRALVVVFIAIFVSILISIFGLTLAKRVVNIDQQWTDFDQEASIAAHALGQIERHFGYGGFIHNFKNYVLRQDPGLIVLIDDDLLATYQAIENYPIDDLHGDVVHALNTIRSVVEVYESNFELAQKLVADGKSSVEIDQQVRINDQPALDAFVFLNHHVLEHSDAQSLQTSQAVNETLGFLTWGVLLFPVVLLTAGIILLFIHYNVRTHQQLVATGQYLSDLFNAAPDAMLIVDKRGKITDSNIRATELFGYKHDQFCNMNVEELMPDRFRDKHSMLRHGAFVTPQHRSFAEQAEFYGLTESGKEIPIEISLNYTVKDNETQAIATLRDVSERKKIETSLRQNENMLNKAQKIAHVGSWEWNILTNQLIWSEEIFRIFGLDSEQFGASYESFVERIHPDDRDLVINAVNQAVLHDKPYKIEHRIVRPDGEERFVLERGDVTRDEAGKAVYMLGTVLDITERKQAENVFRLADNVFNHTAEGIMVTDEQERILRVNQAFSVITGYSQEEVVGKRPNEILKSGKHGAVFYEQLWSGLNKHGFWEGEIWDKRKDGVIFPSWHNISEIKDDYGKVIQYTSIFSDITDKKIADEHIQQLAQYDQLTKLPNRVLFNDRLDQAISRAKRSKSKIALMFIDLDRFKSVNDSLGHHAGDQLLQEVGKRLSSCVREQDTVARLGGDEFTIILEDLKQGEDAAIVANKMLESLSHKVQLGKHEVIVGGSIGISIFPDDGMEPEKIIKNSDMAMYQAKNKGRNQYQFYTNDLADLADTRFHTENRLRQALVKDEFELYYQPQINCQEGRIVGVEALIRWNDPDKGLILPNEFISLAEEMGLIDPIGEWVLATACKQAKAWQDDGYPPLRMSVNVSGYQITHGSIVNSVKQVLRESQLAPEYLELEITESFVMENPLRGAETLNELRDYGITIAIDDFGTGYSSLSYLKQLSIHRLKIDRSFVMDIPKDKDDEAIVTTIISMADSLGLSVIAEGVENEAQIQFLSNQGCVDMQGYYFSRPLPCNEFVELFNKPLPQLAKQEYT